jgi:hypothetical protein
LKQLFFRVRMVSGLVEPRARACYPGGERKRIKYFF